MVNKTDNKFTWVIKNFSSLPSEKIYSDRSSSAAVNGKKRTNLLAYPKGNKVDCLSLFLIVADHESLPSGWSRHALFRISLMSSMFRDITVGQHRFDQKTPNWAFTSMIPLTMLHADNGGFLRNGQVKIVAEIDVRVVVPEEETKPLKKIKQEDDGADLLNNKTLQLNLNEMELMRLMFEKHPDVALGFRSKDPILRTAYINVLLSLIQKLCKPPQELSDNDMSDVVAALAYMADGGFKLDWLEKKLGEVKEKKKKEEACMAQLQEMEEELKPLKKKCLDLEAQMDKKKEEILEARAPLSFDHLNS
ncbi:unnamed protein product [Microthlaspi erraticum]|uniref:MATH domain-containing protein n=1 Tax=Microthlaspi erraticum TaxID=1685480 RepID=A0A6D2JUZ1_9BRAS|nr:unnamed protein product [Microthlaspi erraticum]